MVRVANPAPLAAKSTAWACVQAIDVIKVKIGRSRKVRALCPASTASQRVESGIEFSVHGGVGMGDAGAIKADEKISPLVVDLDGTLLRSSLMLERALAFVRAQPTNLFRALLWAARGNGALREHLEAATRIDVSVLPYEPAALQAIAAARAEGRPVLLAANDGVAANDVAEHLKLFDQVIAGDGIPSGKGRSRGLQLAAWAKALRLHQWVKNALIFVPLLAAHQLTNFALLGRGLLAFVLFGLCA